MRPFSSALQMDRCFWREARESENLTSWLRPVQSTGHRLIIHPSDPLLRGPAFINGEAHFCPFGELNDLINATEPTCYFLMTWDRLHQPYSPQWCNCCWPAGSTATKFLTSWPLSLQPIAGKTRPMWLVSSSLWSPASILELETSVADWTDWALTHGNADVAGCIHPVQARPAGRLRSPRGKHHEHPLPPSPAQWPTLARWSTLVFPSGLNTRYLSGACGQAWAVEYMAFVKYYLTLPTFASILMGPDTTESSRQRGLAVCPHRINRWQGPPPPSRSAPYLARMPKESSEVVYKMAQNPRPPPKYVKPRKAFMIGASRMLIPVMMNALQIIEKAKIVLIMNEPSFSQHWPSRKNTSLTPQWEHACGMERSSRIPPTPSTWEGLNGRWGGRHAHRLMNAIHPPRLDASPTAGNGRDPQDWNKACDYYAIFGSHPSKFPSVTRKCPLIP